MVKYFIVDAFTSTAFKGNPAAVVLLDEPAMLPDMTLQLITTEFNLAETAFVAPIDTTATESGRFSLRWFTPSVEFPLCGHATLATASVLFSTHVHAYDYLPAYSLKTLQFETLSGTLKTHALVGPTGTDAKPPFELELPACEVVAVEDGSREMIKQAIRRSFISEMNVTYVGRGMCVPFDKFLLVEVERTDLERASIDARSLVKSPNVILK